MKLQLLFMFFLFLSVGLYSQTATSVQKKCDTYYHEALILSNEGNSQRSIKRLKKALKLNSVFYPAIFALADLSHESGKVEEEFAYLQRGLAISGDSYPDGFKFLAQILY